MPKCLIMCIVGQLQILSIYIIYIYICVSYSVIILLLPAVILCLLVDFDVMPAPHLKLSMPTSRWPIAAARSGSHGRAGEQAAPTGIHRLRAAATVLKAFKLHGLQATSEAFAAFLQKYAQAEWGATEQT